MKWILFVLFVNGGSINGLPVKEFRTQKACADAARNAASDLSFNSNGAACVPKLGELKAVK